MDLTGSIADVPRPLSVAYDVSVAGIPGGSAAVDTLTLVAVFLPGYVRDFVAGLGGDLGAPDGPGDGPPP